MRPSHYQQGPLRSPYPYFGGKRKAADVVWRRFGAVANYVEPFFGSGAVLLARPGVEPEKALIETINDADGFVSNFWRAIQADPAEVARWADYPVIENDLEARHAWLVQRRGALTDQLSDPHFYDAKIAGWWVWGISAWIGSGWCSGAGPWQVKGGSFVKGPDDNSIIDGVRRQLPHVGNGGKGINRKLPHVGDGGQGLKTYFAALSERLRKVRVCSGDWSRIMGPSVTFKNGLTGIFLDPPYANTANRADSLYAVDCLSIAHDVRKWAIANGDNPLLRIALCGYEGEHEMPDSWSVHAWNAGAGFGGQATKRTGNGKRERIWFSPHCLPETQPDLFA